MAGFGNLGVLSSFVSVKVESDSVVSAPSACSGNANAVLVETIFCPLFRQFIKGEGLGYHPYGCRICRWNESCRIDGGVNEFSLSGDEFPFDEVFSVIDSGAGYKGNGVAYERLQRC